MNPFEEPPLPCPACHALDGQSIAREIPDLDIAIAHYRCNACGFEGPPVTIPADDMYSLRMFDLASAAWNCQVAESARPASRQAPMHAWVGALTQPLLAFQAFALLC